MTTQSGASPERSTYRTREEAMRAANGLRAMVLPRLGGHVSVHDPDGKELQTWIENPLGGYFITAGGFQI